MNHGKYNEGVIESYLINARSRQIAAINHSKFISLEYRLTDFKQKVFFHP